MKDIFRNKRILFALIMCLVVIAIAILVFIIIGMDGKKSKNVSVINLDNSTGTAMTNVTNTTTSNDNKTNADNKTKTDDEKNETNEVTNSNDDDDDGDDNDNNDDDDDNSGDDTEEEENEINFDGEQFYLDAVNDFVEGLTSQKKMEKFIEGHLDIKAYAACYNVEGSDSEFLDEYLSLEDDDEIVQSVLEKLPEIATYDDVKLMALTDPKQSGDNDEINRVILTIKADGKTEKIRMVFYGETVIYIYDDDNKSIVELD